MLKIRHNNNKKKGKKKHILEPQMQILQGAFDQPTVCMIAAAVLNMYIFDDAKTI